MIKLAKKQASIYKQRWEQIHLVQTRELRTTPVSLKFKQLCFLMNSFYVAKRDKKREKEISEVRKRWVRLKTGWGKGGK